MCRIVDFKTVLGVKLTSNAVHFPRVSDDFSCALLEILYVIQHSLADSTSLRSDLGCHLSDVDPVSLNFEKGYPNGLPVLCKIQR